MDAVCLASASAGVRSKSERTCGDAAALFDSSTSLCRRARYARLRSGQSSWWLGQIEIAEDSPKRLLVCLLAVTWVRPNTLVKLIEAIGDLVDQLRGSDEWSRLYWACRPWLGGGRNSSQHQLVEGRVAYPSVLPPRAAALLSLRAQRPWKVYNQILRDYDGDDASVWSCCQGAAINLAVGGSDNWDNALNVIKRAYRHGVSHVMSGHHAFNRASGAFPEEAAETVCAEPSVPLEVLNGAQNRLKIAIGGNLFSVARISEQEGWFEQLLSP